MSHSFIQNCCWIITLQVSQHQLWKHFCKKWKVKLIFRGACRLSGTGIVECSEIIDLDCDTKQFDGLTWLTLIPRISQQIYATGSWCDRLRIYCVKWQHRSVCVHTCMYCEWVSEWVGFNVPINTLQVISETSLSSQSLALVLTT